MEILMPPPGKRTGSYPFRYFAEDTGIEYHHVLALADFYKTGDLTYWARKAAEEVGRQFGRAKLIVYTGAICELVMPRGTGPVIRPRADLCGND